jgi:hypothetical protein
MMIELRFPDGDTLRILSCEVAGGRLAFTLTGPRGVEALELPREIAARFALLLARAHASEQELHEVAKIVEIATSGAVQPLPTAADSVCFLSDGRLAVVARGLASCVECTPEQLHEIARHAEHTARELERGGPPRPGALN